ncbi:replication initiator protein [Peromfec virus RodF8_28]|uniref:Replication initiator protein n=1 Tax=Peromfec virus RodF8_28 TaxID=2929366 RepID=A0A976N2I9_9VIRU|nr:replication initiator protein [Peromfec virus RodF8_28]
MSCYKPMKRFVIGEDFQRDIDVARLYPAFIRDRYSDDPMRKKEVKCLIREPDGRWRPWLSDAPPPVPDAHVAFGQTIPCGTCLGCRVDKSREWANRLLLEKEYYPDDQVYFITLTYDDDHVPYTYYSDPDSGEAQPALTLSGDDLQRFIKRLRYHAKSSLRFFGCGEYGPQTFRPHYHLIVFGLQLADLVPYGKGEAGFMYYQSNWLTSIWSERKAPPRQGSVTPLTMDPEYFCTPLGRVLVSPASWQTFAYVARYTTKKLYGAEAEFYQKFNIEPPFLRMSRRPGIGAQWFKDYPDVYDFEYINVATPTGGRKFRPPHYFDKLFDAEDHDAFSEMQYRRSEAAKSLQEAKLKESSLLQGELLEVEEREFKSRIKKLKREVL